MLNIIRNLNALFPVPQVYNRARKSVIQMRQVDAMPGTRNDYYIRYREQPRRIAPGIDLLKRICTHNKKQSVSGEYGPKTLDGLERVRTIGRVEFDSRNNHSRFFKRRQYRHRVPMMSAGNSPSILVRRSARGNYQQLVQREVPDNCARNLDVSDVHRIKCSSECC